MSITQALKGLPTQLATCLRGIYDDWPDVVDALMDRPEMTPETALMAGLSIDPNARVNFEAALQDHPRIGLPLPNEADEVIVGGGAHAAIYAAVRRRMGYPPPLVLERERRFGGTLAMTQKPTFFLNSRNRPGPLGAPGTRDALNVIPGAPMQPADIGGSEYQTNADLGLVIRCTLVLNAIVRRAEVLTVSQYNGRPYVTTDRGTVLAERVVIATGVGKERVLQGVEPDGKRVFSYRQFMQRIDTEMFPLRGLGRIAVIGGGDSARTVVESLAGIGPTTGMSVASLDYIDRIDWYGAGVTTKQDWEACNRNRYKRIGSLFPNENSSLGENSRVRGFPRCGRITPLYDSVMVNGRPYDTVIVCVGYAGPVEWEEVVDDAILREWLVSEQGSVMRLGQANEARTLVVVGTAAGLPFEDNEDNKIAENRVGLFRLAPRTATVASMLSGDEPNRAPLNSIA